LILDPFVGSGTTAVVAHELDRFAIGIDLNDTYLGLAEQRLTVRR
jgi:DNA modification methylase